jgi:hypothetical protein
MPSLQWDRPAYGQGEGSPRVRPGQRQSRHYVLAGSWGEALGRKCIRRRSTVTNWDSGLGATPLRASPSWQERPGAGLLDAWASSPGYTARFTKAATLTASVPIWSRTLGPALLIGREHGGTLFASDGRPSGAPAQKSKQHQDYTSDSHKVVPSSLLPSFVGSMQSRSFVRRQEKCATCGGNCQMTASEARIESERPGQICVSAIAFSGTTEVHC